MPSLCVFCEKPTIDWQVCANCRKTTSLRSVWVAAEYDGAVAELLKLYKFERVKAAHAPLASALDALMPHTEPGELIIPLPTAPNRIRQRGYDQTVLVAKELANLRGLKLAMPLARAQQTRQVGADRRQRQEQAKLAYSLPKPEAVKGKKIWLVDDICTTSASLGEAAKLIKNAGAAEVNAVVVAWQRLV